jgi:hypothetical protein
VQAHCYLLVDDSLCGLPMVNNWTRESFHWVLLVALRAEATIIGNEDVLTLR